MQLVCEEALEGGGGPQLPTRPGGGPAIWAGSVSGRDSYLGGIRIWAVALGKMRPKIHQLTEALAANWRPHHSIVAGQIIAHIDHLDASIDAAQRRDRPAL